MRATARHMPPPKNSRETQTNDAETVIRGGGQSYTV